MCQYCKTDGLRWRQVEGKWALFYESGQRHLCRSTRDKIVKAIHHRPLGPPTLEEHLIKHLSKEGVKRWMKDVSQPEPDTPPADYTDPWWNWLDPGQKPMKSKPIAAKQHTFEELVP